MLLVFSIESYSQREFLYIRDNSTYIMKHYVFLLLKSGHSRMHDSTEAVKVQELHLSHLDHLAQTGKLIYTGPFEDGGENRGLLIFDVETIEEALELEGEDPAVKNGRLKMEAFYWWGAKGIIIN